jgi:hypothetical protein
MFPQKSNQPGLGDLLSMLSTTAQPGSPMEFLGMAIAGIEAADYLVRKMDQYEKDQRYDDNNKKLIVQATRMFESGQISKAQFKAIIDQLPDTVEAKVEPINQPANDINSMLKDVDPAKLAQLLEMLK